MAALTELTGKQKRFLRAQGHALKPLLQVGQHGPGPAVVAQAKACLTAHELIKVRVLESCPLEREACAQALAQATGAAVAQVLGRTVLLYRPHPEAPVLRLPAAGPRGGIDAPGEASAPGTAATPEADASPASSAPGASGT